MFHLNVWLTVNEGHEIATVANALVRVGKESQAEPGCVRWEAHHSDQDPHRFLLIETWASKADWEQHRQGHAVTEIYLKEVIPRVSRDPHPCQRLV